MGFVDKCLTWLLGEKPEPEKAEVLTSRQKQLMLLVVNGTVDTKSIAKRLKVSRTTVLREFRRIEKVLGTSGRVPSAVEAKRRGAV